MEFPQTVRVPEGMRDLFAQAEEVVSRYFEQLRRLPSEGTIEIFDERYLMVRGASLSVEFFGVTRDLFGPQRTAEADQFARSILFDLAHAIGKSDARNFHIKMGLTDPIQKLSAGPIHFSHSGWAFVDISPDSFPAESNEFRLLYDHPYSFESDAWLRAGKPTDFPVCVMNAGYSAGWCEESFGFPLIASEILCRARGDDCCRFVMAPPDRLVSVVEQYVSKTAELKNAVPLQATQELVGRKLLEDQLREARDELEQRVAVRTAELESANRQLEREILGREAVERRLLQAQKLDALGRLAGGIAHDFNNLLTIINGCAELLQDASKAERAELIADISGAGERAKQLTEQLLVFSKQQVSESDTIDLCRVVDAMSSMLRRLIREDIQLERNICPGPLWVRCNSSQLEQVVVNLTVNARDAMPQGGTLWVDVETQEYDGVDHAMLRVRDTGSGMDKTVLDKIFDPFFSTKERTKGTGLGLSTVYGIIERAGGRVEVDSTLGEGTTVQVRLPIAPSKPAPIAPTVRPISEGALNRAILLVEDEPDVRKLIEKSLLRKGLRVLAAKNAQEAHSLFQSHRDEIQLLLSDVIMPGQSGVELCRELRKEKPELKAVFISGYADHELGDLDLDENATQFLQKPLRLAELHLRIAALLDFSR